MRDLDQKRIHELFTYDPETGEFAWLNAGRAGSIGSNGYRQIMIDGRNYLAHRLAWIWMVGQWPTHLIDHRDLNKLNNAWVNLREATKAQNGNNARIRCDNKVGFKGVCMVRGRYQAQIRIDGIRRYLGLFDTAEAAHSAYIDAAQMHHGEFARTA